MGKALFTKKSKHADTERKKMLIWANIGKLTDHQVRRPQRDICPLAQPFVADAS